MSFTNRLEHLVIDINKAEVHNKIALKDSKDKASVYLAVADHLFAFIVQQLGKAGFLKQRTTHSGASRSRSYSATAVLSPRSLNHDILAQTNEEPNLQRLPFPRPGNSVEHHGALSQQDV